MLLDRQNTIDMAVHEALTTPTLLGQVRALQAIGQQGMPFVERQDVKDWMSENRDALKKLWAGDASADSRQVAATITAALEFWRRRGELPDCLDETPTYAHILDDCLDIATQKGAFDPVDIHGDTFAQLVAGFQRYAEDVGGCTCRGPAGGAHEPGCPRHGTIPAHLKNY